MKRIKLLLFSLFFSLAAYPSNSIIPSIFLLLEDDEGSLPCPTGLGAITYDQSAFRGTTRDITPTILSTLNANGVVYGGRFLWSVSGLSGTGISLNPASGSVLFGSDGVEPVTSMTVDQNLISGQEFPVVISFTIMVHDEQGDECDRVQGIRNHIYEVI